MGFYPVFLEMTGRRVVVIGGGGVAERKVEGLLRVGAAVTVISPGLTRSLESWACRGKIRHLARHYRSGDLEGGDLAFVATDDSETNEAVFREGRECGVWVNAADDPAHCDFILPSVLERGDLLVAVSTGGASPALARMVREELEGYFTDNYALLVEVAAQVRRELKRFSLNPGAEVWRKALSDDFRRLIQKGDRKNARACLLKNLGVGP